jgi:UDP:flavonoid glycosyltransferase YjiC (YdhE family)
VSFARYWQPDLVVWEPSTYAGAIAAKACGAAHARVLVGADIFAVTRDLFLRPAAGQGDPLADWLGGFGRKYGFDFSEDLVTGHFTVDQLPASLRVRGETRYLPMRYIPYGGPAVVPSWLREPPERPRVALTMGLTGGFPVPHQDILDALSDVDVELVATAPEDGLRRVPGNARLVPFVPLQALLPTCSVAVHHAGVGTLATAVASAVPQLALPWDADQPVLAARLAAQGAGLSVPATEATGASVRDSVLRLLNEPGFGLAAAALRDETLTMPTPHQLVPELEELTTRHRTR